MPGTQQRVLFGPAFDSTLGPAPIGFDRRRESWDGHLNHRPNVATVAYFFPSAILATHIGFVGRSDRRFHWRQV
jgi:hypothetical protein